MPQFHLHRLIQFARVTALVAGLLTILCAALIIGWQITSLLREGSWPPLPLSSIINNLEFNRGVLFATASGGEIESSKLTNVIDTALRVPAIVPLLLAVALLTAFYIWLTDFEKKYPGK